MKLSLVFSEEDKKLQSSSYSQTYRDMFIALAHRFDEVQYITESCDIKDITGDVVIFYDVHSSHDIEITGIKEHPLIYSYMNDPHQKGMIGTYKDGTKVKKYGARKRMERAKARGVKYIICPYKNGYEQYLKTHEDGQELVWFPVAPRQRIEHKKLKNRKQEILGNGHLWEGVEGFRPYEFRKWAYEQENVTHIPHCVYGDAPKAKEYQEFLGSYVASLALCDTYVVPKYMEIPLCGCVAIIQDIGETKELGFIDGVNCIMVNRDNFHQKVNQALNSSNQLIADAGYKLVSENYTSKHFGQYIYNHAKEHSHGSN